MSNPTALSQVRSPPIRWRPPLAAAALIPLVIGAVAALADAAVEHDGISRVDPIVAGHLLQARTGPATTIAKALTFVGGEGIVGVLAVLVLILALQRRGVRAAVVVAIGMAGSAVLTVALKLAIGRARPGATYRLGPADSSYSFPSGHTLNSAVLLGLVVLVLLPLLTTTWVRVLATVLALLIAIGVGVSRLYLGYHWTTDVVAAWLVAAAWLTALATFLPLHPIRAGKLTT